MTTLTATTKTEVAINELADRAVRRIALYSAPCKSGAVSVSDFARQAQECIHAARVSLDTVTTAALPAETLTNLIHKKMVEAGLARWNGTFLMVVA